MAVFYGGTDADFLVERGDSWFDQLHDDRVRSANAPVFDGAGGAWPLTSKWLLTRRPLLSSSLASDLSSQHHILNFGNCLGGIKPFRARLGTIHNRVTTIEPKWIFQAIETRSGCFVTRIDQPSISL
jgi:hypothetical protein